MKSKLHDWMNAGNVTNKIILILNKPKTPAEIIKELEFKNIPSNVISKLLDKSIIRYLNPKAKTGRLYGLTELGQRIRKILCEKENIPHSYYEPVLNNGFWNLYSWVIRGLQRKAILKAINMEYKKGKESHSNGMSVKDIRTIARQYNQRISRTNANELLLDFVKKGLLKYNKNEGRVTYSITKKGLRIQQQLLKE